ncbi:MAG TPA: arsenic resistance N-acetyltransferase ArsN2 [Vicinamibacterales bacterium]|jgi:amino-acid N-acetyltransferase
MNTQIEPATRDDGPAVLRLLGKCQLPTDGLLNHLNTAVVARGHDGIVGSAALEVYADGALLRSVAVDATMRGNGLGHRLTEPALELARTLGVPAVYLLTTTAEGFFPKVGFHRIERALVPDGVRASVEFLSACPSTAIAMRKVLADQT